MRIRVIVVGILLMAACSSDASEDVLDMVSGSSTELSGVREVAVLAMGDGDFVVVDGAAERGDGFGTTVWSIRGGEIKRIADLDKPGLMPQGWKAADGTVRIVVMRCDDFRPGSDHRCPEAPLEVLSIDPGTETVDVEVLDVSTSSDIGFTALGSGESILITVYRYAPDLDHDELGFVAYEVTGDLATVTELGPVGLQLACPNAGGFILFPRSLGRGAEGPRAAYAVAGGSLRPVGEVEPVEADVAEVTSCIADGTAQVQVIAGATVYDRVARFDGEMVHINDAPDRSEPPEAASIERASDEDYGRWVAWVPSEGVDGYPEWTLHELTDGDWIARGSVRSIEEPQLTTFSGTAAMTAVITEDGYAQLVGVP